MGKKRFFKISAEKLRRYAKSFKEGDKIQSKFMALKPKDLGSGEYVFRVSDSEKFAKLFSQVRKSALKKTRQKVRSQRMHDNLLNYLKKNNIPYTASGKTFYGSQYIEVGTHKYRFADHRRSRNSFARSVWSKKYLQRIKKMLYNKHKKGEFDYLKRIGSYNNFN